MAQCIPLRSKIERLIMAKCHLPLTQNVIVLSCSIKQSISTRLESIRIGGTVRSNVVHKATFTCRPSIGSDAALHSRPSNRSRLATGVAAALDHRRDGARKTNTGREPLRLALIATDAERNWPWPEAVRKLTSSAS
jgi:hypothetical protein